MPLPRLGATLFVLGVTQIGLGLVNFANPVVAGLVIWSGLSFTAVGIAYWRRAPHIFGKHCDSGRLPWGRTLLLAPFLFLSRLIWEVKVWLPRESTFHEIVPRLFLGRRPRSRAELPTGTGLIVDFTSEFEVAPGIVTQECDYRCLPTLDHAAPPDRVAFDALVREVAASNVPVYVHCAIGRGRSALFVAAVIQSRGLAADSGAAWEMVRSVRSCVGLSAEQLAFLQERDVT